MKHKTTEWNTIVKESEETKQITSISQCNRSYRCTVHLTVPQRKKRGHHKPEFHRQNSTVIIDIPDICLHTTSTPTTRNDAFLFFEGLEHYVFSNSSSLSLVLSSNFDPRYLQYIRLIMQWQTKFCTHYKEHTRPWLRIL